MKPIEHGTRAAYWSHKCRCDKCRDANSTYQRERYAARKEQGLSVKRVTPRRIRAVPEFRHGTAAAYEVHKCRCDTCRNGMQSRAQKRFADIAQATRRNEAPRETFEWTSGNWTGGSHLRGWGEQE